MRRAPLLLVLLAAAAPAHAAGLLEKDHPLVQRGREAYALGRYEDALQAFEAAQKERPDDARVSFDRADALAKLGRYPEAEALLRAVADRGAPALQQQAHYNLGNLAAQQGDRQRAIAAYRRALVLDPRDEDARHNLELVLRNLPPPQSPHPDGGQDGGRDGGQDAGPDGGADAGSRADGGPPLDGGQDGGSDGGRDAGPGDGGMDAGADGGRGDAGSDAGAQQPGDGGSDAGEDGGTPSEPHEAQRRVDGGTREGDIQRQEAERLLDAMKQNERNLQQWRFQKKKRSRPPNDKDW